MITRRHTVGLLTLSIVSLYAGCGGLGNVNQGQVIQYDKGAGLITLISDSNPSDPANPKFDVLPPVVVRVPANNLEMGPTPRAGRLIDLDTRGQKMVVFDVPSQSLRTLPYEAVSQQVGVPKDDPRVKGKKLPAINHDSMTITLYWQKRGVLLTFRAPPAYLALPEDAWRSGDTIRYYYKDPALALRLMNVSRTDLQNTGE